MAIAARGGRATWLLAGALGLALVAVGLRVGPGDVDAATIVEVITARLLGQPVDDGLRTATTLVWSLRAPRTLLAALIGGGLGLAGALTQGLLRNPLAEPGVLGVSSGAAQAAVLGFLAGADAIGLFAIPALAAGGAAAVLGLLAALAQRGLDRVGLLLAGVAIAATCSALVTLALVLTADRVDRSVEILHWLMGTLEARSWAHLGAALVPCLLGAGLASWTIRDLDALALGEESARGLGVDPRRTDLMVLVAIAALVGAATAMAGVLGFVGLVVPHVARRWVGPGHAALLPMSALLGAGLLLGVDVAVRSTHLAIPPGVITSLVGAPFFIFLVAERRAPGRAERGSR
jgi:iron complex transport system permease protein